jgi:putative ABC transport system permease protein
MNINNLFRIALKSIANNKMRSLLTMLGIIIGVASVITMLGIGQGSKDSIRSNISEMGSNMITIRPGADMRGGVRQSSSGMQTLKMKDYDAIVANCQYLSYVSPLVNASGQAIYSSNNTPTTMYGVNENYLEIRQYDVVDGEMFSEKDINSSAKVCIIGQTVIENLFPDGSDPLGKIIRFNKIPFRIVGILEEKGDNSMGMDQDDLILAPYTTVQKRLLAITYLQSIVASATSEEDNDLAIEEIETILRNNHGITNSDDDDFYVRSQQEMLEMMSSTLNMLTILLACIAGISLLVGGIGIMNIMFVSVTERTREIGLRMSIGAKGRDILWQFLIEAIVISITGGLLGIFLGIGVSYIIENLFNWPISIQLYTVILSFTVCSIIGIFFGWYPARKASNLDPIEAIRYE